jgi:DNA-binding IclR family transcriptional regulator
MTKTGVLDRCLLLLDFLAEAPGGIALGDLSKKAGLPKSGAHRILNTMIESGIVVQDPESREYRLTMKLLSLAHRFLAETQIIEHCQVILENLAEDSNELVRMTVVDRDQLVWIAKAQGARGNVKLDPLMGKKVPLHAAANGKIWLASLPTEKAVQLVLQDGFGTPAMHGPNVIQTIEDLLAEIQKVKKQGYAVAWEEADPNVAAVAAAIRASDRRDAAIIGTVSIAGPVFRFTKESINSIVPRLHQTAEELTNAAPLISSWWREQSSGNADVKRLSAP